MISRERSLGVSQFLAIIVVAIALFFVWNFWTRINASVELERRAAETEQRLQQVEEINAQLVQLREDVTTDTWVEKKARIDYHYARENETLLVPITTREPAVSSNPVSVPAPPPPRAFWQDWLDLLFGPSPAQ